MGNLFRDKALDRYLKSSQKYAEDDEAKIDELKILGTLNSLRRSAKCCVASLKLIREENLVSNVDFCFAHIKFHERNKNYLARNWNFAKC